MARQLVIQTIKGSMTMLERTGEHPAILKAQVCSPGGTTIAAVRELEENGIRKAFFRAIEKCRERSIELGKH
jgi:pyrroline-5-carboxylate reductase